MLAFDPLILFGRDILNFIAGLAQWRGLAQTLHRYCRRLSLSVFTEKYNKMASFSTSPLNYIVPFGTWNRFHSCTCVAPIIRGGSDLELRAMGRFFLLALPAFFCDFFLGGGGGGSPRAPLLDLQLVISMHGSSLTLSRGHFFRRRLCSNMSNV